MDLYTVLRRFSAAEATEECDKIYALLGMCRDGFSNFFPDLSYKHPIGEIIRNTASYLYSIPPEDLPAFPYATIGEFLSDLHKLSTSIPEQLVHSSRNHSLKSFVEKSGLPITDNFLKGIAKDDTNGQHLMKIVLEHPERELPITQQVLLDVAKNQKYGKPMMERSFSRSGPVKFTLLRA